MGSITSFTLTLSTAEQKKLVYCLEFHREPVKSLKRRGTKKENVFLCFCKALRAAMKVKCQMKSSQGQGNTPFTQSRCDPLHRQATTFFMVTTLTQQFLLCGSEHVSTSHSSRALNRTLMPFVNSPLISSV